MTVVYGVEDFTNQKSGTVASARAEASRVFRATMPETVLVNGTPATEGTPVGAADTVEFVRAAGTKG